MELPPPHVLAQLDAIIVGQESIVADHGDLQTVDDDDDRSVSSETLNISSSATSFSEDGAHDEETGRSEGTDSSDGSDNGWAAGDYTDVNGKKRTIGRFDTQEAAAHAYNAAIRALPPDVQRRRRTNPVVDGQLVPRARKAPKKRRREESGAANAPPPARARTEE